MERSNSPLVAANRIVKLWGNAASGLFSSPLSLGGWGLSLGSSSSVSSGPTSALSCRSGSACWMMMMMMTRIPGCRSCWGSVVLAAGTAPVACVHCVRPLHSMGLACKQKRARQGLAAAQQMGGPTNTAKVGGVKRQASHSKNNHQCHLEGWCKVVQ